MFGDLYTFGKSFHTPHCVFPAAFTIDESGTERFSSLSKVTDKWRWLINDKARTGTHAFWSQFRGLQKCRETISQSSWCQRQNQRVSMPCIRISAIAFAPQVSPLPYFFSPIFGSQQPHSSLWNWPHLCPHSPLPQTGGSQNNPASPLPPAARPLTLNERRSYYQATVVYSQLQRLALPTDTRHPTPVYYFWRLINYYYYSISRRKLKWNIVASRLDFSWVHIQVNVNWKAQAPRTHYCTCSRTPRQGTPTDTGMSPHNTVVARKTVPTLNAGTQSLSLTQHSEWPIPTVGPLQGKEAGSRHRRSGICGWQKTWKYGQKRGRCWEQC